MFCVLSFVFFFGRQKIFFVSCVIGFYRLQAQHIVAHASHSLAKVQHVRLYCEHAGFCCEGWDCCEHWSPYIERHRAPLCVLLTHVWRPAFSCVYLLMTGQFPGEQGLVASGMSAQFKVRFMPDSLGEYQDEIHVQSQSQDPLVVKVVAKRPPPILTCKYLFVLTCMFFENFYLRISFHYNLLVDYYSSPSKFIF